MSDASRDENRIVVGMGVDENGVLKPLLVDPVTHKLLVVQTIVGSTTPVLPDGTAVRDENRVTVASGLSGSTPQDLLIDSRNNLLWIKA